jgi:uncharacterized lipoprotein YmbA
MRTRTLSIIPIALVMSACFSLGRDTPTVRQYALGGTPAEATERIPPDPTGIMLGLRRLDLTPYLASQAIVVRRGAHQVLMSEYDRWAENPVAGINRAFAIHLAAAPPVRAVDMAPWPVRSRHDFVVQLHVSRFEGVMPEDSLAGHGEALLAATWELSRPQDGRVVARGSTQYRADGWLMGDYAALVALLDDGLKRRAGDIVRCMSRVGPTTPSVAVSAADEQPLQCASGVTSAGWEK